MFCAKCGAKIPDGFGACPACGWQRTNEHKAPSGRVKRKAPLSRPPKKRRSSFNVAAGCLTTGLLASTLFVVGAVLLFNHRGFAWETWKSAPTKVSKKGSTPESPLTKLRDELLSLSAEIAGLERGMPNNPVKIAKRLDEIESELARNENDPLYIKVYALLKSVEFQFKMTEESKVDPDIPPLPYSTFAIEPSDEYVLMDVTSDMLLKGKILPAGKTTDVRYGPALLSFLDKMKVFTNLYAIDAPKGYKYVEVIIEVEGQVDLVEYDVRMLDDYRRAYPAFLGAEKEARKRTLSKNHYLWRDVAKLDKSNKTVHLHRIFLMPSNSISRPILEIKRQGASRMVWVQY